MTDAGPLETSLPAVTLVAKPLSLIPVGLKEAALDSPTFRATAVHFSDQVDSVEKWLHGLVTAASKLSQEITVVESLASAYLASSAPPTYLSEALLDQDYAAIAIRRYNEGAREFWTHAIAGIRKAQGLVLDPIKAFLQNELRSFKDARRQLDQTQRYYDTLLSRYYGQTKTKDSSGLREDAFQLYEAKKSYLRASMDFCIAAPQFRSILDFTLIKVFSDRWFEMKDFREMSTDIFAKNGVEITRVRDWSREMQQTEKVLRQELQQARMQIEESTELSSRPSRELDDYSTVAGTFPQRPNARTPNSVLSNAFTRQGWVFLRTVVGKPARYTWVRRWAFVKNGIFGWLVQGAKSGGVEESEKIGVLLCSVRPAVQEDRRFCFEVITNDSTVLLQAENQTDLAEWVAIFARAKQKAFEESTTADIYAGSGNPTSDSAFAVSPAVAPELAAKRGDGQIINISEDATTSGGVEIESVSSIANRYNADVGNSRRATGDRDGDTPHRLMQKLDMHRKSPVATPASSATTGIANLISASHTAFSIATGRSQASVVSDGRSPAFTEHATTLAPPTLANPPSATNLTRTTILLGMEKGYDLGVVDATGGVPSGIMANQWGSANYGHISRIARGEVKVLTQQASLPAHSQAVGKVLDPQHPVNSAANILDDYQPPISISVPGTNETLGSPRSPKHKTIISNHKTLDKSKRISSGFAEFPVYYPQALKAHDAQFRVLFPNRTSEERVVLVIRATWSPDGQQELSGRAFITPDCIYFYSHHYFVLVSSVGLRSILEVSAIPGSHHDFLYVHLKADERGESSRISLKVFLEPFRLLQRRLNFLVANANSEDPAGLEAILQTLIKMEFEFTDQVPGVTNWEDHPIQRHVGPLPPSNYKASLRVDRGLYDGPFDLDRPKFRLPAQPVEYAPPYINHLATERVIDISAKALFHMIFGDKSAVFQMLYRQRRSQGVKQYPWAKQDSEHFSREFEYQVETTSTLGLSETLEIKDSQIIDVYNDHLCYVVSDRKTPWHLPLPEDFTLLTKIVITHVAKSRCKIACFTKVDWLKMPGFTKTILERYALEDLQNDAIGLIGIITDQVQKMGHNCGTQRAIQIFGHIGQQMTVAAITSADPRVLAQTTNAIKRKTLKDIVVETAESFAVDAATKAVDIAAESASSVMNVFSTHRIMTWALIISLTLQLLTSYRISSKWWQERSAATFMARIGVQPHMTMSKGVYIKDLERNFSSTGFGVSTKNQCSAAFKQILEYIDRDAPHNALASTYSQPASKATARRIHHTRQRLATYRHDLLVSMRLVNRIESDSIQAEYENWVAEEDSRCKALAKVLRDDSSSKEASQLIATLGEDGSVDDVKNWYKEYCAACHAEQAQLVNSFM